MFGFDECQVPDRILVLDTETTGLDGARLDRPPGGRFSRPGSFDGFSSGDIDWASIGDLVVDIGICEVSLSGHTVRDVYSAVVGYDTDSWTEEMRNSWVFENTDLTVDQVSEGRPFAVVRDEVASMVKDRWLTTYNVQYDLEKFLYRFPWNLKGLFMECRDIMFSARDTCRLENPYPGMKEYRYPKLEYAYEKILCGEDPAGINGVQDHRALSDARVASHLMLKMHDDGRYDPVDLSGRHSA